MLTGPSDQSAAPTLHVKLHVLFEEGPLIATVLFKFPSDNVSVGVLPNVSEKVASMITVSAERKYESVWSSENIIIGRVLSTTYDKVSVPV